MENFSFRVKEINNFPGKLRNLPLAKNCNKNKLGWASAEFMPKLQLQASKQSGIIYSKNLLAPNFEKKILVGK